LSFFKAQLVPGIRRGDEKDKEQELNGGNFNHFFL